METTSLQTKSTEIKKTWETPTLTEIDKSMILGGTDLGNDGNTTITGAASASPVAS
jgi:hypothetical protein